MRANPGRGVLAAVVVVAVLAGCSGSSGKRAATGVAPTAAATTGGAATSAPATTVGGTSTTGPANTTTPTTTPQTSGSRTVLSPTGLNVRAQPDKAAALLGTAAQGTVLTVLAHSDQAGGWFQVKGATVTGWISDNAVLSAQGKFGAYQSSTGVFNALYPAGWASADTPPASVVFRAPAAGETIVVTSAATASQLGTGHSGYRAGRSEQIVACGVTTYLVPYTASGTPAPGTTTAAPGGAALLPVLAQVRLTLDPQHALGVDANLTDLSHLQTVRDFVNSLTFPFPQCEH